VRAFPPRGDRENGCHTQYGCHIVYGMKMTMHIDEKLLASVMKEYGFESKTEAVEKALWEMDRRAKLARFAKEGLGLTPEELANAVDPDYDLMAMRVAEIPPKYGSSDSR
jgi:Arc/MetJ family transcription regulator